MGRRDLRARRTQRYRRPPPPPAQRRETSPHGAACKRPPRRLAVHLVAAPARTHARCTPTPHSPSLRNAPHPSTLYTAAPAAPPRREPPKRPNHRPAGARPCACHAVPGRVLPPRPGRRGGRGPSTPAAGMGEPRLCAAPHGPCPPHTRPLRVRSGRGACAPLPSCNACALPACGGARLHGGLPALPRSRRASAAAARDPRPDTGESTQSRVITRR
ncbi:MAG: hypothetical protein J3K34DRAFT_444459 [Monoraphidium minutum]|nr:MAG: hypothetical protein J3K34DRAFT_444459 [Monoraphidium minutum]